MASIYFYVCGTLAGGYNYWKMEFDTGTNAISVVDSNLSTTGQNNSAMVKDSQGNFYISERSGLTTVIRKYDSNYNLDVAFAGGSGYFVNEAIVKLAINGDRLALATSGSFTHLLDLDGTAIWTGKGDSAPKDVDFSPNGNVLATGTGNGVTFYELDRTTGDTVRSGFVSGSSQYSGHAVTSNWEATTYYLSQGGTSTKRLVSFDPTDNSENWEVTYASGSIYNDIKVMSDDSIVWPTGDAGNRIKFITSAGVETNYGAGAATVACCELPQGYRVVVGSEGTNDDGKVANINIFDSDNNYLNGYNLDSSDLLDVIPDQIVVKFFEPTDITLTRKLYAIGGNEFWYESTSGTMSLLTDSKLDISTGSPLTSSEAFQKVFIANGSNLKVADFRNHRITSAAKITTNVPAFGDLLTQDTTNAVMSVDYIYYDTTDSVHYVYGFVTTGTFNTTDNVRDASANIIITGANLSAVTEGPLWYDWTSYNSGEDSSFAGMPTQANIVATYRGRLVLAGDKTSPIQWYMSRQNNPFDWAYAATDAQAPIAGGNGDVGKSADIITALIPIEDDYMIVGCANSVLLFRGDPADNGSLDEITRATGIYGARSWCFDNEKNIYFYGSNGGIWKITPAPNFSLQNISKNALPKLD